MNALLKSKCDSNFLERNMLQVRYWIAAQCSQRNVALKALVLLSAHLEPPRFGGFNEWHKLARVLHILKPLSETLQLNKLVGSIEESKDAFPDFPAYRRWIDLRFWAFPRTQPASQKLSDAEFRFL